MSDNLVIVFIKNLKLGKVKTRLAKTIGDQEAFEVYKLLVKKTEEATQNLHADKHIYFSDAIIPSKWPNTYKTVQKGSDLGERMKNAFKDGFEKGYKNILLIGSDLPDISEIIINEAFEVLKTNDTVFGPAEDGGYYLVGLKQLHNNLFSNIPWSTSKVFEETIKVLDSQSISVGLLQTLNDIDTFEDFKTSSIYKTYLHDKIHN
ncbi:TIGR04282 family arsenosugar biosynthesis glycosyltransferase [Hanstruepera flava]|uniref:TIGR04282 family arsenosugar biosynthesis glycosyltransferase n=1 Tax=Hanstruepera flava TaxID=2930218 RepID=UPI002029054E|nr:TIGR04282 family arsenosugar biosynthesis glycosyltransferase [Hanstruepera flava]